MSLEDVSVHGSPRHPVFVAFSNTSFFTTPFCLWYLFLHPFALKYLVGYSSFCSVSRALIVPGECSFLQAFFSPYASRNFQRSLSVCKYYFLPPIPHSSYILSMFFSTFIDRSISWSLQILFAACNETVQLYWHTGDWTLHSSPALFSLCLMLFSFRKVHI